jgi:superfamily I DNA and/or RNA helicase
MSLANVLAVSQAANNLVLIGDPRQLEQPILGSHPEGTEASALTHILGQHATIPADRGLFLGETWRLHPEILPDILIIAPYNAQVFELQDRIPGARIGTVDKFQGQEAPIVIYSITTSSYLDAPRGMEFLYSLNRLNVATYRARAICVMVGSPAIFEAECRTPRQMQLANAFCRYLEMAVRI